MHTQIPATEVRKMIAFALQNPITSEETSRLNDAEKAAAYADFCDKLKACYGEARE